MHPQDAVHPLPLLLAHIEHLLSSLYLAGIHADVAEAARLTVMLNLEHQAQGSAVGGAGNLHHLLLLDMETFGRGNFIRGRKIVYDSIDEGLHTSVAAAGPAEEGNEGTGDGAPADFPYQGFERDFFSHQKKLGNLIVVGGNLIHQPFPPLTCQLKPLWSHIALRHLLPLGGSIPADFLHPQQVDDTLEVAAGANGKLQCHRSAAKFFLHVRHGSEEVRPDAVHLVDKADAGNLVLVGLVPHRLGLGLHAAHRTDDGHRSIQHPQGALHLGGKVHVARSVDDVNLVVPPPGGGGRRLDGDAPLLLLAHPVHGGGSVVNLADSMYLSSIIENTFCCCCFARVDMGHDSYISHL